MAKVATLREIKAKTPDVTINVIQSLSGMDGDKYTKQYLANVEGLANHIANDRQGSQHYESSFRRFYG